MSELERYNKAKEEAIKEYNKALNGETLNASKLMYEYLGEPKDHIDYFNKKDYEILQERLKDLAQKQ